MLSIYVCVCVVYIFSLSFYGGGACESQSRRIHAAACRRMGWQRSDLPLYLSLKSHALTHVRTHWARFGGLSSSTCVRETRPLRLMLLLMRCRTACDYLTGAFRSYNYLHTIQKPNDFQHVLITFRLSSWVFVCVSVFCMCLCVYFVCGIVYVYVCSTCV